MTLILYLRPETSADEEAQSMRFRLVYDGPLMATQPNSGAQIKKAPHKQDIRKKLHVQLRRLWGINAFLKSYKADSLNYGEMSPIDMIGRWNDGPSCEAKPLSDLVASKFEKFNYRFVPLVLSDANLSCSLDILMLSHDGHHAVVTTAGDLDNRVKTLIDSLRMPRNEAELAGHESPGLEEDPFYCLLEDDDLITGLTVQKDNLLTPIDGKKDEDRRNVMAIISVEIRPYNISMFNLNFS